MEVEALLVQNLDPAGCEVRRDPAGCEVRRPPARLAGGWSGTTVSVAVGEPGRIHPDKGGCRGRQLGTVRG